MSNACMRNIGEVKNCFGCGVCATVCAKDAIKIVLNPDGFYAPILDTNKCVDCGLCADVCAFLHDDLAVQNNPKQSFGAWSNNPMVRRRCSSGGVGYELGKHLLNEGYKVCAVKYNVSEQRAEHYIATNEQEFIPSIGSKYIQSYTVDGFKAVNRKEQYLVTGTPCQIDSFRRYLKKFRVEDNFVLMDFFCHSVPSTLAWKKYLQIVEKKTGPVTYASWRNKFTGWHGSWAMVIDGDSDNVHDCNKVDWHDSYNIYISGKNHFYNSRLSQGDLFYKLFLGDYCCNPACQKNCKYKFDKSSADIRIGDFWGQTYSKDEEGVSSVIAFTDKGKETLKQLDCTYEEHPFELVAEGQMKKNVEEAYTSAIIYNLLNNSTSDKLSFKLVFIMEFLLKLPKYIINKVKIVLWER